MHPFNADAAAVIGLAKNVREPGPWRPGKFRLLVLTTRWPEAAMSPFMAMHMEQPGFLHSQPESMKT